MLTPNQSKPAMVLSQRLMLAAGNLPDQQRDIFDRIFLKGQPKTGVDQAAYASLIKSLKAVCCQPQPLMS